MFETRTSGQVMSLLETPDLLRGAIGTTIEQTKMRYHQSWKPVFKVCSLTATRDCRWIALSLTHLLC